MRLVKQSFLYFKEGNSDKVYEITLADVGNDRFVVNFRYGRRNAVLKEGTKTAIPVSSADAEKIYDVLLTEKLQKGYTTSDTGVSSLRSAPAITIPDSNDIVLTPWEILPTGRERSILRRLSLAVDAVQGKQLQGKTPSPWKMSRFIWKAGEYKIKEAAPYIIKLFTHGDVLHQYSCTWALARCRNEVAVDVLRTVEKEHPSPGIRKIAGAGLLMLLTGEERTEQAARYRRALPVAFQVLENESQSPELAALIQERIAETPSQYKWLESLYLLSLEEHWVRRLVIQALQKLPFQPGYFKHVRAIYKLSELLDDFEIEGLLACRLEREEEFFKHYLPAWDVETEIDVDELDDFVNPHLELKKQDSLLAYSQRTRWYLHHRIERRLRSLGRRGNTDYVRLATAILTAYDGKLDAHEPFTTTTNQYINRSWVRIEQRYPAQAQALLLHEIVNGDNPALHRPRGLHVWRFRDEKRPQSKATAAPGPSAAPGATGSPGLLKKLIGLFTGKKQPPPAPSPAPPPTSSPAALPPPRPRKAGNAPYPGLWDQLPESYVQLLVKGQLEEIYQFALQYLPGHPEFPAIKEKLEIADLKQLLLSPFPPVVVFAFDIVTERYGQRMPPPAIVAAMLNAVVASAREEGKALLETHRMTLLEDSEFIADLLFIPDPATRDWVHSFLKENLPAGTAKTAAAGRALAKMMGYSQTTDTQEALITGATDILTDLFAPELEALSFDVIADLLRHPSPAILVLGLRMLKLKREHFKPGDLSKSLLFALLMHSHPPVREAGLSLLTDISDDILLGYTDELIQCCLSAWSDVRQGLAPLIGRLARRDKPFGDKATATLLPWLLRKETSEGLHEDLANLISGELSDFLPEANKEKALNLLYGNYSAAQRIGLVILEKYLDPNSLTLPQIVALGGHENLHVRQWCWKYYREQPGRIKYERDTSIKLLESKWEDSRQFAMQYFKEQFTEGDWTPEVLISLADSVKPDVEAYGRELITRFFKGEDGSLYLLKLSQHPGEKMQLFVTNYLERYAGGDPEKIRSLEFYFRTVLTRVNKSRIAKERIFEFLLAEGKSSAEAANTVSAILTDISATAAIGDKARCIAILVALHSLYGVPAPMTINPIETRPKKETHAI